MIGLVAPVAWIPGGWVAGEIVEPPPSVPPPTLPPPPVLATPADQDEWGSWKWAKGVCPQAATLLPQSHTLISESPLTRKRRTVSLIGDRWVYDLEFRNNRKLIQRVEAVLARLKGPTGKVALYDFERPRPLGAARDWSSLTVTYFDDGTITFTDGSGFSGGAAGYKVHGNYQLGDEEIRIIGFPQHSTQLVGADQIGLNGRLYRLTRDATSDGLGIAHVYLHRGLLSALSHGTAVVTTRPTSPFSLVDDDQAARSRAALGLPSLTLRFIEAL